MAIHRGNAVIDGARFGGWFIGDRPTQQGLCYHRDLLLKYGVHAAGEECQNPYQASLRLNISILVDGGPFVHCFRNLDGSDAGNTTLENPGDYVIYDNKVTHTWQAVNASTILTVQYPSNN
jgi:hypothetical protein